MQCLVSYIHWSHSVNGSTTSEEENPKDDNIRNENKCVYFVHCLKSLMIGSVDLVKTNSHPGDPYTLTVEVSKKIKKI